MYVSHLSPLATGQVEYYQVNENAPSPRVFIIQCMDLEIVGLYSMDIQVVVKLLAMLNTSYHAE